MKTVELGRTRSRRATSSSASAWACVVAAVVLLLGDQAMAQQPARGTAASVPGEQTAAGLSAATIRMLQHSLIQGGYDVDAADGVWGAKTAAAVREFQKAKGLEPTGRPDSRTLEALGVPSDAAPRTSMRQSHVDDRSPPQVRMRSPADLEPTTIRAIQQALDRHGLQVGAVDGVWGDQTTAAIANFQRARGLPASGQPDAYTLAALGLLPSTPGRGEPWRASRAPGPADLDPASIRLIQRSLKDRGFKVGSVDGIWGHRTTEAVREFQKMQGIDTGSIQITLGCDTVPAG